MSKSKKAEAKLYKQWRRHLSNSRLKPHEITRRAKNFTKKKMTPGE